MANTDQCAVDNCEAVPTTTLKRRDSKPLTVCPQHAELMHSIVGVLRKQEGLTPLYGDSSTLDPVDRTIAALDSLSAGSLNALPADVAVDDGNH